MSHARVFALLALLLVASACATAPKKDGAASGEGLPTAESFAAAVAAKDALVDEGFRFALLRVAPDWLLQSREQASRMVPAALAGAQSTDGRWSGVVVVEESQGLTLEQFAALVKIANENRGSEFERQELGVWEGRETVHLYGQSRASGLAARLRLTVFLHQGYAYQVHTFALESMADEHPDWAESFLRGFRLLEGTVDPSRHRELPAPDQVGYDWRITGNVFQSEPFALELAPQGRWRLLSAMELQGIDATAEFGLAHAWPDLVVVFTPDHAEGADAAQYVESEVARIAELTRSTRQPETFEATLLGEPIRLHTLRGGSELPATLLVGARCEGRRCLRVNVSRLGLLTDKDVDLVRKGLAAVRPLPPDELPALRQALAANKGADDAVGTTWSFRSGIYRNFLRDVSWHRPDRRWRVRPGEGAFRELAASNLTLLDPVHGLYGALIFERPSGSTPQAHHAAVSRHVLKATPQAKELQLGGRTALVSDGMLPTGLAARLATVFDEEVSLRIAFWGRPEDFRERSEAVDAALRAYRVGGLEKAGERVGAGFIDRHLGFVYQPPPGKWGVEKMPETPPLQEGLIWSSEGEVFIISAMPVPAGVRAEELADHSLMMMTQSTVRNLPPDTRPRPFAVAGREVSSLWFPSGGREFVILMVPHGGAYLLLVASSPELSEARLGELLAGFELLD